MPIRLRLSLAFTGAGMVLVALGGWVFVAILSSTMLGSIDTQLATAAGLAASSTGAGSASASAPSLPGEYMLQVLDPSGRVARSSPDTSRAPLLDRADRLRAAKGRIAVTQPVDGEPTRVLAQPYHGRPGWVAVAAVSLESYNRGVGDVIAGTVGSGIAVVLVAALGSYALARGALAPVERMRREVAALAGAGGTASIPVPPTNDELALLARTMNDIVGRLGAALERERAFVADASHELRSPLAVLGAELELAQRPGRTTEDLRGAVASAAEEAARLNRLTEDLLLLARSDSDRLLLRWEEVDVAELLERSAQAVSGRAATGGVRVDVAVPGTLPGVLADAGRLRQAVDNLVDNSLRYSPRGGSVELRAWLEGDRLVVEVVDQGAGFPAEFLPHAFERFRRPGSDRHRDDGGAGLGLAIVRAIAEAHAGTAAARNREGGGAAVRITLPVRPPTGGR